MNTMHPNIIEKAINAAAKSLGTKIAITREFGFKSAQSIPNWILRNKVPSDHVIKLCELGGWVVTPHELRPDLHPTPTSGIPDNTPKTQKDAD